MEKIEFDVIRLTNSNQFDQLRDLDWSWMNQFSFGKSSVESED